MEKPKTLRERAERTTRHPGDGSWVMPPDKAYEAGFFDGAKLAWEAALDAVEFDTFSGPRVTKSFDDWLATIMEGK